ncbi:hypothetical protein KXV31_002484 [Aspergillus fumigatus]|nr:hypothetical protein KXW47_002662 [Aspergillus fumigatus]KAH2870022.1 hypothetical protein KXV31_002484 [Aspergillus fumigatus]
MAPVVWLSRLDEGEDHSAPIRTVLDEYIDGAEAAFIRARTNMDLDLVSATRNGSCRQGQCCA